MTLPIFDINPILAQIRATLDRHRLDTGKYSRWLWQDKGGRRKLGINEYGCADAANILYTLNCFPQEEETRRAFVQTLQSFQNPQTGMFHEPTHIKMHSTAHCTAALELFDARPLYKFSELEKHMTPEGIHAYLEGLAWGGETAPFGHEGAGIYPPLVITRAVGQEWLNAYFGWLDENCDTASGLWRKDFINSALPMWLRMGAGFHFLFNYADAKRQFPYPEALIDTCLDIYDRALLPPNFGECCHFIEMDWVYCLNRASRQTPHRFYDIRTALYNFAEKYIAYLESVDWERDESANDLHLLFGALCCIAELQLALPGIIQSTVPLRLVLDRRPFI